MTPELTGYHGEYGDYAVFTSLNKARSKHYGKPE
jgi:hypothetical protein